MSLFGGDSAPQSPDAQNLNLSPAEALPSPPSLPNAAQDPPLVSFSLHSDEEDVFEEEGGSDTGSEIEPSRPNRFVGNSSTWQRYTAADRQIAASLEDIESADLAVHLYNAHYLKHRLRRPAEELQQVRDWQSKDSWLKKGEELHFTDQLGELQTDIAPSKLWTAWPLSPRHNFATGEAVRDVDGGEDVWYIGGAGAHDAGEAMRGEALALFLRQAKEKWLSRDFSDEAKDISAKREPRAWSEAKSVQSKKSQSTVASARPVSANLEMQDDESIRQGAAPTSEGEPRDVLGQKRAYSKRVARKPQPTEPALLADDDKARCILQPSIESLLAHVDKLALTLRRSRLNHFGRGERSDRSGSEFTSDAESIYGAASFPRTQSRGAKIASRASTRPLSRAGVTRRSKQKRRRSKNQRLDDSDSASDFEWDLGEDSNSEQCPSRNRTRRRNISVFDLSRRNSHSSTTGEISTQVGLMDWSEVLGVASITGWNEKAVARTAQRCAALFGEAMSFRRSDESLTVMPTAEAVPYSPAMIPDLDELDVSSSSRRSRRPYFDSGTLRCPHNDCWGAKQDFKIHYRVVEHLMRVHEYDPRDNNSDNEERKYGGVHIDGFLQPITAKQGWLGGGRSKSGDRKLVKERKKRKIEEGPASPVVDADTRIL